MNIQPLGVTIYWPLLCNKWSRLHLIFRIIWIFVYPDCIRFQLVRIDEGSTVVHFRDCNILRIQNHNISSLALWRWDKYIYMPMFVFELWGNSIYSRFCFLSITGSLQTNVWSFVTSVAKESIIAFVYRSLT